MTSVGVRRSGGLLGQTLAGSLDLAADDEAAREARVLVAGLDAMSVPGGPPRPDMFVYTFRLPGREEFSVPEQLLTPALARLAELVLSGG